MASSASYTYFLPLLLVVASCATSRPEFPAAAHSGNAASSGPWLQYADVRQAGFDGQALRAVCECADSLQSGALMRVFLFDEKPYVHLPGVGDVQMFPAVRRDLFAVRAVQGMGIAFERGARDEVTAVTLTFGDPR
jgi:hypothetical protein